LNLFFVPPSDDAPRGYRENLLSLGNGFSNINCFLKKNLLILSKGLMGEDITIDLVKSNKSGCLGMIVLFISVSTLITYFFL
jgi:hypothetical protein